AVAGGPVVAGAPAVAAEWPVAAGAGALGPAVAGAVAAEWPVAGAGALGPAAVAAVAGQPVAVGALVLAVAGAVAAGLGGPFPRGRASRPHAARVVLRVTHSAAEACGVASPPRLRRRRAPGLMGALPQALPALWSAVRADDGLRPEAAGVSRLAQAGQ